MYLLHFNPHAPDRFTPSRARCAKSCGALHTDRLRGEKAFRALWLDRASTRWLIYYRLSQLNFDIPKILVTPSTLSWRHNFHQPIRVREILSSFLNFVNTIIQFEIDHFFRNSWSKQNFLRFLSSEGLKLVFSKRRALKSEGGHWGPI